MIVHIVMFEFKEQNKSENLAKVKDMLEKLVDLIPALKSMEVGIDISRSERSFDMVLTSTFDDLDALCEYAIHPEHLKVVDIIKNVTNLSKVVDYELDMSAR